MQSAKIGDITQLNELVAEIFKIDKGVAAYIQKLIWVVLILISKVTKICFQPVFPAYLTIRLNSPNREAQ